MNYSDFEYEVTTTDLLHRKYGKEAPYAALLFKIIESAIEEDDQEYLQSADFVKHCELLGINLHVLLGVHPQK